MDTIFLDRICRCCLNESGNPTNLLEKINEIDDVDFDPNLTYSDALYLCTNIHCDLTIIDANDQIVELPKSICEYCLNELRMALKFRAKCETSNQLLHDQVLESNQLVYEHFCVEEIVDNNDVFIATTNVQLASDDGNDCQGKLFQLIENDDEELITVQDQPIVISCQLTSSPARLAQADDSSFLHCDDTSNVSPILETISTINSDRLTMIPNIGQHKQDASQMKVTERYCNWFECDQCKKGFKIPKDLTKHIEAVHDGRSRHLCNFCGQLFSNESTLKSHLLLHQEKRYKCDECSKSFFTKKGYETHCNRHENKEPKKKFLCSDCGKDFTTRQRLRLHMFTHTGEKNHNCDLCSKTFATESRLRSHRRIHTGDRPFKCLVCGLTFGQSNALKCHNRIHTGERPYECNVCHKKFRQNTILKTHMTLHTGKKVKCPDCDKKFSRASYLILHRREHTGEKPYACSRCPSRYKQKSHLDRHMDTHLGIKHTCEICKKEYSKQWSLKVHMFSHSDVKPWACEHCSREFIRKDKYKNHVKLAHGLQPINSNQNRIVDNKVDAAESASSSDAQSNTTLLEQPK